MNPTVLLFFRFLNEQFTSMKSNNFNFFTSMKSNKFNFNKVKYHCNQCGFGFLLNVFPKANRLAYICLLLFSMIFRGLHVNYCPLHLFSKEIHL